MSGSFAPPSSGSGSGIADPGTSTDRAILVWNGATGDAVLGNSGLSVANGGALQTIGSGLGSISPNPRGSGSIDLSTSRTNAAQVAAGNFAINLAQNGSAVGANSFNSGRGSAANGADSFVLGPTNTVGGTNSGAIGESNTTSANNSICIGSGNSGTVAGISQGTFARTTRANEISFSSGTLSGAVGEIQSSRIQLRRNTLSAGTYELNSPNRLILQTNSLVFYRITVLAARVDVRQRASYTIEGTAFRAGAANTITLVGTQNKTAFFEDDPAWDVTVDGDTTNGAIRVQVVAGTGNIVWIADCQLTELNI